MTFIYDGVLRAKKLEEDLSSRTKKIITRGDSLRMVSILVGNHDASNLYLKLKKNAAERVGIDLDIVQYNKEVTTESLLNAIRLFNKDKNVDGIMIQLPLPNKFTPQERDQLINAISVLKDVDGMREDSPFVAPTVRAIYQVLIDAQNKLKNNFVNENVVVVGANGFVGTKTVKYLKKMGYKKVVGVDIDTEASLSETLLKAKVVISATGIANLINKKKLEKGVVLIDVGVPGDISRDAYVKSSFVSPGKGGVGPLTIYFLLDNLLGIKN